MKYTVLVDREYALGLYDTEKEAEIEMIKLIPQNEPATQTLGDSDVLDRFMVYDYHFSDAVNSRRNDYQRSITDDFCLSSCYSYLI